jgi:NAD(P)-dependent dehydrogenase (short-subunit alcohol dehydrogenase family)
MSKLNGKVAVVTGASKGIGAGIAKALGEAGASVVVNYASRDSLLRHGSLRSRRGIDGHRKTDQGVLSPMRIDRRGFAYTVYSEWQNRLMSAITTITKCH